MNWENENKLVYHLTSSKLMELFEMPDKKNFDAFMGFDVPENFIVIRHLDREKEGNDDSSLEFTDESGKILHTLGYSEPEYYYLIALLKLL